MKMGAWSPLAVDRVRYVGDAVAVVVAETKGQARDAAEAVEVTYKEKKAVTDAAKALEKGAPQLHPEAEGNLIFDWELGDAKAADAAIANGCACDAHDTSSNNRLVPNAMEPRAALGHYDKGEDHYTCWTTSQNPHLARLVMSAFYNVAPENKLRVIAPDVGGGFGSKIFIYPEELVCLLGLEEDRRAGEMGGRPDRELPRRCARPRPLTRPLKWRFDKDNRIIGLKVDTIANFGAYMSLFSSSVPTYLYATLSVGPVRHPGDPRQCPRRLHQHGAGRCLSWRRAAGGDLCAGTGDGRRRTRDRRIDRIETRRRNVWIPADAFPIQRRSPGLRCGGASPPLLDSCGRGRRFLRTLPRGATQRRQSEADCAGSASAFYMESCGMGPSRMLNEAGCRAGQYDGQGEPFKSGSIQPAR